MHKKCSKFKTNAWVELLEKRISFSSAFCRHTYTGSMTSILKKYSAIFTDNIGYSLFCCYPSGINKYAIL